MADVRAPRWAVYSGAMLACVIATGVPGLAAILQSLGHHTADREAFVAELFLAIPTALFGALQTRAQFRQSRRWVGVLLVFAMFVTVFIIGFGVALGDAVHTVDGGGVIVIGGAISLGAAFLQSLLALFSWWAIASIVRVAPSGDAALRLRFSGWLLAMAGVHLVLKLVSGGSVFFAALAAVVAALVARGAQARTRVGFASVVAVLGIGLQARSCSAIAHDAAIAELPMCDTNDSLYGREADVLAKKARAVPHVADAATDTSGEQVTVYVLPLGGGPLDEATKRSVEQAIAGTECAVYNGHEDVRATQISVQGASYVPLDVLATFHANAQPPDGAEKTIDDAVRATFDPSKPGLALVRVPGRHAWSDPWTPSIGGWVEYRVGEQRLQDLATRLPAGGVVKIGRVDVTVIRP